jgi:anion-transporting  ArsA/GET3 family ATPase
MVWVTLPEEMPVNETIEFVPRFEESLDITLDHVIVNGVHPEVLDTDEQEAFEELKDVVAADKSELYNLVNCVEGLVVRGTRHRAQIRRLHESIDARILEIPVSRSRGPELVGMVADIIERDEGRQERRPA